LLSYKPELLGDWKFSCPWKPTRARLAQAEDSIGEKAASHGSPEIQLSGEK
jgi:hypothetical protein